MKEKIRKGIRTLSLAATNTLLMANTAFAAVNVTEESTLTMVETVVDITFVIMAGGQAMKGAFKLIPAVSHFIEASESQNGEQRKEAGTSIGTAIMQLVFAGLIFLFKSPIKSFLGLS